MTRFTALILLLQTAVAPAHAAFEARLQFEPHFERVPAHGATKPPAKHDCVQALTPEQIRMKIAGLITEEINQTRRPVDRRLLGWVQKRIIKDVLKKCSLINAGCTEEDVVNLATDAISERLKNIKGTEHKIRVWGGIATIIATVTATLFTSTLLKDGLGEGYEWLSSGLVPIVGSVVVMAVGAPLWRIFNDGLSNTAYQFFVGNTPSLKNSQAEKFDRIYTAMRASGLSDAQSTGALRLAAAASQLQSAAEKALEYWEAAQGVQSGAAVTYREAAAPSDEARARAEHHKTKAALKLAEASHYIEEYLFFISPREEDLIRIARNNLVRWIPDQAQRQELALRTWAELERMDIEQMKSAESRARHEERLALWLELASSRTRRY